MRKRAAGPTGQPGENEQGGSEHVQEITRIDRRRGNAGVGGFAHAGAHSEKVKIGFVTTLTVGPAVIGRDMKDAVELAVEHIGGKMGGKDVEVIFEDDGFKPEIGKQKTEKLVASDKAHFVAGYIWSNVLLASYKSVVGKGPFLISSNAGPSDCRQALPRGLLLDVLAERPDPDGNGRSPEPARCEVALHHGAKLCRR